MHSRKGGRVSHVQRGPPRMHYRFCIGAIGGARHARTCQQGRVPHLPLSDGPLCSIPGGSTLGTSKSRPRVCCDILCDRTALIRHFGRQSRTSTHHCSGFGTAAARTPKLDRDPSCWPHSKRDHRICGNLRHHSRSSDSRCLQAAKWADLARHAIADAVEGPA